MKAAQTRVVLLLALLPVAVCPGVSIAENKPCRGFVGTAYTRVKLLSLCGEPNEILEQETKRSIFWRYRGYPFTPVRSMRIDSRDTIEPIPQRIPQRTSRGEAPRVAVDEQLFRTILDEASAQSTEPAAPK